jgi:hypothetical protein
LSPRRIAAGAAFVTPNAKASAHIEIGLTSRQRWGFIV